MDQAYLIWEAAGCGIEGWQNIWGDPWLSGTVMVAAYALTGAFLLRISGQLRRRERSLWRLCGLIFLFQAINTPLDMHAFVLTFGKCLAHAQGWYGSKDIAKAALLIIALSVAVICLLSFLLIFRRNLLNNVILISGVGLAVSMTASEAINIGSMSGWLHTPIGAFTNADLVELLGVAIAFSALMMRYRRIKHRKNALG